MHDLVIRNGRIVDGSGAPAFVGDVAIDAGVIVVTQFRGGRFIYPGGPLFSARSWLGRQIE